MGGGGGWFYNGEDGKFLKSLYIVGRRVVTPLFYKDSHLILSTPLFQIPSNRQRTLPGGE